ncbi:MAG: methyltransferase domain-containing protein, partial [Deltaproteobacteria bacterium]|nr:methyltransferase domain-containing protein [Deltaproteobacteria bacterium]
DFESQEIDPIRALHSYSYFFRVCRDHFNQFEHQKQEPSKKYDSNLLNNAYRFWILLNLIQTYTPSTGIGTILDMGVYPGTLVRLMRRLLFHDYEKWNIIGTGLALTKEFREGLAPFKVELFEQDFDDDSLEYDYSCDLVICSEVIEHVFRPLQFLETAFRNLKTGGRLILTTPNISYFEGLVKLATGRSNLGPLELSYAMSPKNDWRGHVRLFSRQELEIMASRVGFTGVSVRYMDFRDIMARKFSRCRRFEPYLRRMMYMLPLYRPNLLLLAVK